MRPGLLTPRTLGALVLAGTASALPAVRPAVTAAEVSFQPAASAGLQGSLSAVAAASARNAWAVGTFYRGSSEYTLTEHWDGTRWRRVPSPTPGFNAALTDV